MCLLFCYLSLYDVHLVNQSTQIGCLRCLASFFLPWNLHRYLLHDNRSNYSYACSTQTDGNSLWNHGDASKSGSWCVSPPGWYAPVDLARQQSFRFPPTNPFLLPSKLHLHGSINNIKERRLDLRLQIRRKRFQKAILKKRTRWISLILIFHH